MWALIFITVLCFLGAWHYHKLYRLQKTAQELRGEVVSFAEYRGWRGQSGWKYYELIVEADGKTYKIRTDNTKARKYRKQRDVVILVPEIEPVFGKFAEHPDFRHAAEQDPEGAAKAEQALRQMDEMIARSDHSAYPTQIIIREDRKQAWQVWFLTAAGVCFAALLLIYVISEWH